MAPRETKTANKPAASNAREPGVELHETESESGDTQEIEFTSLTADWVVRGQASLHLPLSEPGANAVGNEEGGSFLVQKGAAAPSMMMRAAEIRAANPLPATGDGNSSVQSAGAPARHHDLELELDRLCEALRALQATLAEREAALGQAYADIDEMRDRWDREFDALLAKAESFWKDGEATRLAEARMQWRAESERTLAETAARCARAEAALNDLRHQANTAAGTARDRSEAEQNRLREELKTAQAALASRDSALAQARVAAEQMRDRWQQEVQKILAKAEMSWKEGEATRLAAAQAQWREQSTKALAEARQEIAAARNQGTAELAGLREELAAAQLALMDRETALARADLTIERMREQEQPAVRAEAGAARGQGVEMELHRLREELAAMQAALMDRETALARADLTIERTRARGQRQ